MITDVKVTNSKGDEFRFDRLNRMTTGLDLSGLQASVNRSGTNAPGSRYQNTKIEEREFDIAFNMMRNVYDETMMDAKRGTAYKVFNPTYNPMRVDFKMSDGKSYYLTAELLSTPIMPTDKKSNNAAWQKVLVQFVATDPFIYHSNSVKVVIALWVANFEFPLEIPVGGLEMGYRSKSLIANVFNEGQQSTGMVIRFTARGSVVNPSLINVNTYESIKLNFTMLSGDKVEINTYRGRRSIILTRDNVETTIFNTLDFDTSKFLQLAVGDNLFRYDAEAGIDNLEAYMIFTPRLVGV